MVKRYTGQFPPWPAVETRKAHAILYISQVQIQMRQGKVMMLQPLPTEDSPSRMRLMAGEYKRQCIWPLLKSSRLMLKECSANI